ncbi:MAG: type I restriction enzyme HsdR N-terminal domain-containing protein [Bacteroidota bacterium]
MYLDLLQYQKQLKIKKEAGQSHIWDLVRKKWLVLQPEELVRQLIVLYLIDHGYNANRFSIERGIVVVEEQRRCDLIIYDKDMNIFMVVECKAPKVPVKDLTYAQLNQYNYSLRVPYLMVSNGRKNLIYSIDHEAQKSRIVEELPAYL